MTRYLERAGLFKAKPIEWQVKTASTGTVFIEVSFEVLQVKDGEQWKPIDSRVTKGQFYPIKKDKSPNEKTIETLCTVLGWGGSFAEVSGAPPWKGWVQIEVDGNTYNNKTYYKVSWLRDENAEAAETAISPDRANHLDAQHGIAIGSVAKQFAKPKPATPAPAKVAEPYAGDHGDIPFALLLAMPLLTMMFQ